MLNSIISGLVQLQICCSFEQPLPKPGKQAASVPVVWLPRGRNDRAFLQAASTGQKCLWVMDFDHQVMSLPLCYRRDLGKIVGHFPQVMPIARSWEWQCYCVEQWVWGGAALWGFMVNLVSSVGCSWCSLMKVKSDTVWQSVSWSCSSCTWALKVPCLYSALLMLNIFLCVCLGNAEFSLLVYTMPETTRPAKSWLALINPIKNTKRHGLSS